jgi:hypothetical protein
MTERSELENRMRAPAVLAHDLWLRDAVAGLLAAGVRRDQIAVQFRAHLRTVVMVDGETKAEYPPPAQ